ncbi:MAG: DUF2892 domain-containing protein [Syntrophobacteraceae bacterium]
MTYNVCGTERIVRAVLGVIIILAGLYYASWWGLIGLIPLLTAVVRYCPISHVLHFSTCPVRPSQTSP